MLEYDKIDVSQRIDVNETNASKECNIYHYWYFLDKGFKFEPYLCNGSHDLMQKAVNFNDVAIFSFKVSDYRIHFWYMRKNEAISITKNSDLNEESDFFCCINIRRNYCILTQKSLLEQAKECYENNKKDCKSNQKINIDNYLMKKKT